MTWLDMTEDKIDSVSKPVEDKEEVDHSLKEAQSVQNELARKKPELKVLMNNAQVC